MQTRRLYLLRHAQAAPSAADGGSDHRRPLDAQGLSDAESLGRVLAARGVDPERVLVSAARRTRQTWECLAAAGLRAQARFEEALYNGTHTAYLSEAAEASDGADLMMVGHNPVIASVAVRLAKDGTSLAMQALSRGFPTCGLAILRFEEAHWLEDGYLEELLVPPHRPR